LDPCRFKTQKSGPVFGVCVFIFLLPFQSPVFAEAMFREYCSKNACLRKGSPAVSTLAKARLQALRMAKPRWGLRIAGLLGLLMALGLVWWEEVSPVIRLAVTVVSLSVFLMTALRLGRLRKTQSAYQLAMQAAHDGFWEWDPVSKQLTVGARLLEILGYSQNVLPNTDAWLALVHPDDLAHYNQTVSNHLKGNTGFFYCEYRVRAHDGQYRWIASRGVAIRNRKGIAYQMAGSVTDITERKQYEETIAFLAHHDALTGLPNRTLLASRLAEMLDTATEAGVRLALAFIDLDRFKDINDSQGHFFGDRVLEHVAHRLESALAHGDLLARQGGDEFIAVFTDIRGHADAEERARRFLEALKAPFHIDHAQVHIGASMGLSLFPDDAKAPEALLSYADTAMYVAKRQGGSAFCWHKPEMKARLLQKAAIETRLHQALEQNVFELYYQPQFEIHTGHLLGAEALLRWQDQGQWIGPDVFIPVAEETGLIVPLGLWVLETAIRDASAWQVFGPVRIAVNLSPRQFWEADLASRIEDLLKRHALPPSQLELEITESLFFQAESEHIAALHRLRTLGIRLALDDFGTGYSSLSYLSRLPFTGLKIDRSFVMGLFDGEGEVAQGSALCRAIIAMAHGLELEVVAEGVETEGQLLALREMECDIAQGYLGGRPVPEAVFIATHLKKNLA
jgi:diguanylate cyclase (GGDEF)-like protein/PAS domain S-box-containing protein